MDAHPKCSVSELREGEHGSEEQARRERKREKAQRTHWTLSATGNTILSHGSGSVQTQLTSMKEQCEKRNFQEQLIVMVFMIIVLMFDYLKHRIRANSQQEIKK